MGKVKKSESLKGVSVPSLDLIIDEIMEHVPRGKLDLASDEGRAKMRDWIHRIGRHLANEVADAMAEAAGKSIGESAALFINPRHYEDVKKRRERRRLEKKMKRVEEANAHRITQVFGKNQFIQ